ncbi:DAPG hydrolase family protein [Nocardia blacklockiae]|uniref:DAPG hydrolase family protein n=1 Tax=Nocardia blacklockiae TaxID=480036 RepID=UPI0018945E6A|nr:hypothetical protein [Nocardia blacklockiae]MBF6169942.1 hypothetical protein [Nocardia blacklockiae]
MVSRGALSRRAFFSATAAGAGVLLAPDIARAQADTGTTRYAGYSPADWSQPYSRFMTEHTLPAPPTVTAAFDGPPTAPELIPEFGGLAAELGPTGYSAVETGYGQLPSGVVWVAVHTHMPRVSAAMWDWWFDWHSIESARYKLWHPDAHMFAATTVGNLADRVPGRPGYIGTVSYVDEYIGPALQQLAIAFEDPRAHGFEVPGDQTIVFARVGSAIAPVDLGRLAHQVRPVPGGSEMRSRFYLNVYGLHVPDAEQAAHAVQRGPAADPRDLVLDLALARNLLLHCGQEMNHLAQFLPELHAQFA